MFYILTQFVNVLLIVCGFIYKKNFELLRTVELISRVTIENRDKMSLNILVELLFLLYISRLFCPKNIKVKNLKKHTHDHENLDISLLVFVSIHREMFSCFLRSKIVCRDNEF